jgi:hypothetical protein|tara:strand:+ start:334 stop:543 length:210 start_codon:yes stop_codon:yes gene_type:complete
MKLKELIEHKKKISFVDDYDASDAEALGLLISQYFEYDGEEIFSTLLFAMEDANFHEFNAIIKREWKRS